MTRPEAEARLADLLRKAYSGELAAALAYAGHARSLPAGADRDRVLEIEAEELHHREMVGGLLAAMGSGPSERSERRARRIGSLLAALCGWTGWVAPMWGAGRLERGNIVEYEVAARLAVAAGRPGFTECLLAMAEVEWEHERFFRERVLSRRLGRMAPLWEPPPPKGEIRGSFAREFPDLSGAAAPGRPAMVGV